MTLTIFVHENGKTSTAPSYHLAKSNGERRYMKSLFKLFNGEIVARWTIQLKCKY